MTTPRCQTASGPYRCQKADGHEGDCEWSPPLTVTSLDFDARRELVKAARRIDVLERALREIRHAPCDASGTSCPCCLHDRAVATAALDGVA